jgi:RloB-like protein
VCEGETEQEYFEAARIHYHLTTAEVVVADNTKGSAPISVVECAEERAAEQGGYDTIFCVFDRDGHQSFDRALAKIRGLASRSRNRLNMHEAISVPCFELWVLLHFERSDRPFQKCADVVGRIRREHLDGYVKANDEIARHLLLRVETALANARWLEGRTGIGNENPSTSVNAVLQHLKDVADAPCTGS